MRYQGKIVNWKDDQGFGFVIPNGGGDKSFVHIKAFSIRSRRPIDGDLITYERATDKQGRFCAENIRFTYENSTSNSAQGKRIFDTTLAILFCSFVVLSTLKGWLPSEVLGGYLGISTLTFLAYAIDKSAAQKGRWRTKESTLHIFGLVGGWPGAVLAQKALRHKSKKKEFQLIFRTTVLINCTALGWLLTKDGTSFLASIIR